MWVMDCLGPNPSSDIVQSKARVPPTKPRVILAACGCVAAAKFGVLCRCFIEWAEIRCLITKPSLRFIDRGTIPNDVYVYSDSHESYTWRGMDVELLEWADIMVIAPLSANTLAKITGGLCDNLLTSTVRAWDPSKKLIFAAPSMSTLMWKHPLTEEHCTSIVNLGITLIRPFSQRSGEEEFETGAMADPSEISLNVRIAYRNISGKNDGRA